LKVKPPIDVTPLELFESLCELRPQAPIDFRFAAAPDVPLYARALTDMEWARSRRSGGVGAIVAFALLDDAGPVFSSAADVGLLDAKEHTALCNAVADAHDRIAPTWWRCEMDAWFGQLRIGASQSTLSRALMRAFDVTPMGRVIDHPEWFWGVPSCELNEGHWLVYRAARELDR
jgi:hypothetical protein